MSYDPRLQNGTYERTLQMQAMRPPTFSFPVGTPFRLPGETFDLRHDQTVPSTITFDTPQSAGGSWALGVPLSQTIAQAAIAATAPRSTPWMPPSNIDMNADRMGGFSDLSDLILASTRSDGFVGPDQPALGSEFLTPMNIAIAAVLVGAFFYLNE
jgi:hypothetical protein